jgi:predicted dehydrogenase
MFKNRIPEVGEVNFATTHGYGTHPAGLVHTISAIQHLFGPGIETVRVLTAPRQTSIYLDYGGGKPGAPKHGITINTNAGVRPGSAITISILGTAGDIHAMIPGDRQYVDGTAEIIKMIKRMVETREVPPLMDDVVESIAVIEAFRKARGTGKPAAVAEFLGA